MLKPREVGELAKALNVALSKERLGKFVQIDEDVLSFSLTRGRRLVFVLYPEDPSCYLSSSPLGLTSLSTPLSQYFRKELGGASVLSVSQAGEDRVLLFSLLVVNDVFQEEHRTLVLELLPHHPNLLLLDEEYKILFVKKPSPSLLEKRVVLKGMTYVPPSLPFTPAPLEKPFDFEAHNQENEEKEGSWLEKRKKERFASLFREIKTRKKALERKLGKLEKEAEEARAHLQDGEYGNYIFTNLEDIDLSSGEMDVYGVKVSLDKRKSLPQNAEAFFKRAKKAKATLLQVEGNKESALKELERLETFEETVLEADEENLERLGKEYRLEEKDGLKHSPLGESAILPYCVEIDGVRYLFGKNAMQNDYLSFLYATKKNRLWFHVKEARGAHLILQKDDPSLKEIETACALTLLASGKKEGEVQYAPHKDVRRGSVKGQAILRSYQSATIRHIPETIEKAFLEAKKAPMKR